MAIKSVHDARYRAVIEALRHGRLAAGFTQVALASELGRSQQFVSKFESFERRLDVIEFVEIATILSLDWREILARQIRAD